MNLIRPSLAAAAGLLALAACDRPAQAPAAGAPAAKPAALAASARPTPAPGLWQTTMALGPRNIVSKTCYDAATAAEASLLGRRSEHGECKQNFERQPDGSYRATSDCTTPRGVMHATGVLRGDFKTAYTVELTSSMSGDDATAGPAPRQIAMTLEAKRLGDCPADFKPGDIEINGTRMNMTEMRQRRAERQQQASGSPSPTPAPTPAPEAP